MKLSLALNVCLSSITALPLCLLGTWVYAAEAENTQIEEIVVRSTQISFLESHATAKQEEYAVPVQRVADMSAAIPGVDLTGQGGHLQTMSVRGFTGERIGLLIDDIPVQALRRAGSSLSFADPRFFEFVVTRSSHSVREGSGNVGGSVSLNTRHREQRWVEGTLANNGLTRSLAGGIVNRSLRAMISVRSGNDADAGDGTRLNSAYRQVSALSGWTVGDHELRLIGGRGHDVGKSNSDFPARITIYDTIDNLLGRYSWHSDSTWANTWAHYQKLVTSVSEPLTTIKSRTRVLDFGTRLRHRRITRSIDLTCGADLFGRSGFDIEEEHIGAMSGMSVDVLKDGAELEFGAFIEGSKSIGNLDVGVGGRLIHQVVDAHGRSAKRHTNLVGDASATWHVSDGLSVTARIGNAVTLPTVTQLYFSGVTGRGVIVGNPRLERELAWSYELGTAWHWRNVSLRLSAYSIAIDDLIDKVRLTPDTETFINVNSANVKGVGLSIHWQASPSTTLRFAYSRIRGEDDGGSAVSDIPNDNVFVQLQYRRESWEWILSATHSRESHDIAPGNRSTGAYTVLNTAFGHQLSQRWKLRLHVSNLSDVSYFPTNDDKGALAAGRSVGLTASARF